ncbi:hypothetical protein C8R45DRAFT_1089215 [Mycena sanguinolenta]|nr:hypothetical protein C8R45DRAFT_1089215 [Mycena sanguinolenta]
MRGASPTTCAHSRSRCAGAFVASNGGASASYLELDAIPTPPTPARRPRAIAYVCVGTAGRRRADELVTVPRHDTFVPILVRYADTRRRRRWLALTRPTCLCFAARVFLPRRHHRLRPLLLARRASCPKPVNLLTYISIAAPGPRPPGTSDYTDTYRDDRASFPCSSVKRPHTRSPREEAPLLRKTQASLTSIPTRSQSDSPCVIPMSMGFVLLAPNATSLQGESRELKHAGLSVLVSLPSLEAPPALYTIERGSTPAAGPSDTCPCASTLEFSGRDPPLHLHHTPHLYTLYILHSAPTATRTSASACMLEAKTTRTRWRSNVAVALDVFPPRRCAAREDGTEMSTRRLGRPPRPLLTLRT